MKKIRIGIVGCGAIGKSLAKFIDRELNSKAEISAVCDLNLSKAAALKKSLNKSRPIITNLDNLIKNSDLVIESSSAKVSYSIAKKAVSKGKSILIMSIGGIILKAEELFALARKNKSFIYLPSGAICGIDGLKALSLAGIKKVTLTTRKPPKALAGVAYLMQKGIDVNKIKKETVIFEGSALNAIKYFPQNINVAALLSIAGIGAKKTKVKIVSSPQYKYNYHEIEIVSQAGVLKTISQNVAFKENPKTSYLAALSAMAVLKGVLDYIRLGN
ncbi:MAG: aspartate dehydrogenase [Candidatus Omnitrophica bacterium]|nr:aspartate dehydrogenase [Candidatus Omnitrophota bacterium]